MRLGFIGLGNMASAIIGGIIKRKVNDVSEIVGADVCVAAGNKAKERYGIEIVSDNKTVVEYSDCIFLAVKPQYYEEVINEIRDMVKPSQIIVTIAPGKTLKWMGDLFGKPVKIVRCMPNTPALVLEGCTGVCSNEMVDEKDLDDVLQLLRSFGTANVVPEKLMDVVVGISGSSPAYAFLFMEAMADEAVAEGMPRTQAYEFAAQALLGSAKMLLELGKHPGELKDMVCSPAGTTIQAVKVLEEKGFRGTIMDAVEACILKSRSL